MMLLLGCQLHTFVEKKNSSYKQNYSAQRSSGKEIPNRIFNITYNSSRTRSTWFKFIIICVFFSVFTLKIFFEFLFKAVKFFLLLLLKLMFFQKITMFFIKITIFLCDFIFVGQRVGVRREILSNRGQFNTGIVKSYISVTYFKIQLKINFFNI